MFCLLVSHFYSFVIIISSHLHTILFCIFVYFDIYNYIYLAILNIPQVYWIYAWSVVPVPNIAIKPMKSAMLIWNIIGKQYRSWSTKYSVINCMLCVRDLFIGKTTSRNLDQYWLTIIIIMPQIPIAKTVWKANVIFNNLIFIEYIFIIF